MNASGDADYRIENNLCTMRFERTIARPVEAVWAALTEPDQLTRWFYPLRGTLAVGETVVIPWDDAGLTSTIVEFDPPRVLAWTWHQPGEPESIVRWEVVPEGEGARFILTHALPILGANEPTDTLAGWHVHVDALVEILHGAEGAWSNDAWRGLKDRYAFAIAKRLVPGDDGILEIVNGRRQLRFARVLDAPLDRVWEAVGTAEGLSGWFTPVELDPRPGGSIALDFTRFGAGVYTYPVVAVEPPRVFAFQFSDDPANVVRIEFFDGGEQTLLVLTNTLAVEDDAPGIQGGWHYHLDRLPSYLAGESDPRPDDHVAHVTARYREFANA